MADVMRSSGGSVDETLAALDALFARERTQREAGHAQLAALVAGLSAGVPNEPEPVAERRVAPTEFRDRPEPAAYQMLPRRTTHGGPFGASIVERVAASIRKDDAW
jgi:hypothetical protein